MSMISELLSHKSVGWFAYRLFKRFKQHTISLTLIGSTYYIVNIIKVYKNDIRTYHFG